MTQVSNYTPRIAQVCLSNIKDRISFCRTMSLLSYLGAAACFFIYLKERYWSDESQKVDSRIEYVEIHVGIIMGTLFYFLQRTNQDILSLHKIEVLKTFS